MVGTANGPTACLATRCAVSMVGLCHRVVHGLSGHSVLSLPTRGCRPVIWHPGSRLEAVHAPLPTHTIPIRTNTTPAPTQTSTQPSGPNVLRLLPKMINFIFIPSSKALPHDEIDEKLSLLMGYPLTHIEQTVKHGLSCTEPLEILCPKVLSNDV